MTKRGPRKKVTIPLSRAIDTLLREYSIEQIKAALRRSHRRNLDWDATWIWTHVEASRYRLQEQGKTGHSISTVKMCRDQLNRFERFRANPRGYFTPAFRIGNERTINRLYNRAAARRKRDRTYAIELDRRLAALLDPEHN